ncbi:MAG: hypothetical protein HC802_16925, partial [Caldilineaceae bacterium]|nr:hypothetical protein [Caldilineaceae bacterium]
ASAFNQAIAGEALTFPTPDPDALDADEEVQAGPLDPAETLDALVRPRSDDGEPLLDEAGNPLLDVVVIEELVGYLQKSTPLKADEVKQLTTLGWCVSSIFWMAKCALPTTPLT